MIWIDSIDQLQYYHQPESVPCYCDILVFPADLMLQGAFNVGGGSYTIQIDVMSASGVVVYENATAYFDTYFAVNPFTGQHFFNAKLKSFSPAMCSHACYILHVKVSRSGNVVFDKYTERYCQSNCCDYARDISVTQTGIVVGGGTTTTTTATSNPKLTECGDALITLATRFDCYDSFAGDYYGMPADVLSGSAGFTYRKITNMRGRVLRQPREIQREYSYNCRLQKVESKATYMLEGFEYFPQWKMIEIESQLHASEILVEGRRYEYGGGTPFEQLHACREVYKLNAELEDCTVRQVFGCPESCGDDANFDGAARMFVIPESYAGGGFYNESKMLVADDYAQLLLYMRSLDGITAVNDIDITSLDCIVYKAFSLSGTGYLPGSLYFDQPANINRVFGIRLNAIEEICAQYAFACAKPVIADADIELEDQPCIIPELGMPAIEDVVPDIVSVYGNGNWELIAEDSEVAVLDGFVAMSLKVRNATLTENPDAPGEPVYIPAQAIAVLGASARPAANLFFSHSNSALPEETTLYIYTNGFVYYSGYTTAVSPSDVELTLTNITYNL